MPYNSYFNQYIPQQNYQQVTDERIWVQSEQAAENYLVAPNGFVRLWNANKPEFYERRSDPSGRPYPMEVYEYKKKEIGFNSGDSEIFLAIGDLKKRIAVIEEKIGGNHVSESNANDAAVQSV